MRLRLASVLVSTLVLTGCGSNTLDRDSLQKEVEAIGSAAAEGALLAHDASDGRTTTPFTEVHSDALRKQVRKSEDTLESATAPAELRRDRDAAAELADRVSSDLRALHAAAGDEQAAAEVAAKLDEDAKAAEELAQ